MSADISNSLLSSGSLTHRVCVAAFAVLVFATTVRAQEVEPNDTLTTATQLSLVRSFFTGVSDVTIGNGPQGFLDIDLYSFVLPADWAFPINLTAEMYYSSPNVLLLRLFDGSGMELANDDGLGSGTLGPSIRATLITPGTYYLGVSTASNPLYKPQVSGSGRADYGGQYAFWITVDSYPIKISALEPNNDVGNASWMGFNSFTVLAEFVGDGVHSRFDVDIYRLSLLVPARLDILVFGNVWFEPVVRVRNCEDPLPTPTTMDRCSLGVANDERDGLKAGSLTTAVFEPGDVFIMVSGSGNRGYDPAQAGSGEPGSVGAYNLSVVVNPLHSPTPNEPNDSILTATQTPLLIEGRPDSFSIGGYVGDGPYAILRGDRDFYAVRVVDGSKLLSIDIETAFISSDLSPVLVAYDSKGRVLAYVDGSETGDEAHLILPAGCIIGASAAEPSLVLMVMGTQQRLPNDPFDPFDSYIGLVGEHRVTDGPGSTGTYRLTVSSKESAADCVQEPNDTATTATSTGLVDDGFYFCANAFWGDSQCRRPNEDVDLWSFRVEHPPIFMRAEAWDCDAFDKFDLQLLDEQGNQLAFVYGYESGDSTSIVLAASLTEVQTYFLALLNLDAPPTDIFTPCSCYCSSAEAPYDISVSLSPVQFTATAAVPSRRIENTTPSNVTATFPVSEFGEEVQSQPSKASEPQTLLFGTGLNDENDSILVLGQNGALVANLTSPELPLGGTGGLATNGDNLFFLGAGRFPVFYKMDPTSGDVLEQYFMWIGSGYYTDATMLGNELYLLDHRRRQVHVMDPFVPRYIRSLSLGSMHGISIGGGIAALSGPNRLYVADAYHTESIYEIHPATGALTGTLPPIANRPTALAGLDSQLFVADFRTQTLEVRDRNGTPIDAFPLETPAGALAAFAARDPFADFDSDGDVDLLDVMAFQNCFQLDGGVIACPLADSNGDTAVDLVDANRLATSTTGP